MALKMLNSVKLRLFGLQFVEKVNFSNFTINILEDIKLCLVIIAKV